MLVLGLDPSLTNYGWALHETTGVGQARCVGRGRFQTSTKMLEVARYIQHRENVESLVRAHKPDKVALEYPVFNAEYSSGMYGLFLFTFEALYNTRADVVFFSNSSTKAVVSRYLQRPKDWGGISKLDMIEAAKKDTGSGRWASDEADAYWAAVLGGRFWELHAGVLSENVLTVYERGLFTEIYRPTKGKLKGRTIKKGYIFKEGDRFFLFSHVEAEHGEKEG